MLRQKIAELEQSESDRKWVEEALQRSKAFSDSIIKHSPHAIWISDDKGTLIRLNQACCDLLHIKADEVVGKYNVLQDTIVIEQGYLPLVKRVFEQGETSKFTMEYDSERLKNLELRERVSIVLDVTISPVLDAGGRVIHAIIQHIDITDRKRAEEALRLSEENFRRSLDESPLGVRIVTIEGETIYANQAMLNIYRYDSVEELRSTPLKERYTPRSYAEFQIRKEKRKRGDDEPSESEYEISIVRKDGEVRHLQVFRKEILWNGERQFQTIYQDITARKLSEDNLRSSNLEKEILLREVHHRVKNNMQVISGLLDLQASSSKNPELIAMFHESQSRIQAMSLVHEKLYGSKDFARIDLAGYVRTLSQDLFQSYKINPGKIDLIVQPDGDVYVDINKAIPCGLILNELISNALKHAFSRYGAGEITIIIGESDSKEIEIVVRDNGLGLPDDVDIHQPRSAGLHLVNGLVKNQLDGQMEVRRDNGTEFRIKFPL